MDSAADVFLVPIIKSKDTVLKASHVMEVRETDCFGDAQALYQRPTPANSCTLDESTEGA